jgi:hypothetical protein
VGLAVLSRDVLVTLSPPSAAPGFSAVKCRAAGTADSPVEPVCALCPRPDPASAGATAIALQFNLIARSREVE